jgi:serine/threonine-protein kinase
VVTVHDMGEHGGDLHVVMELFEGRSLRAILDERSRLPLEEAVPLLAQAASGLAAAHALGVVHRDVKPDNLLVDGAGRLKIVDFGLAFLAAQARITTDSKVAMTPRYCSPEQILGEPVDARSDVFSLGCVIYETLTGEYAFDGESVSAVFYRILYQTPPPQVGTSALPARAAALVSRCLARGPDSRPTSCDEVARELHAMMRDGEKGVGSR